MKHLACLVGVSTVFAAATAYAQPSLVEPAPELQPPLVSPATYVSLGGAIGADLGGGYIDPKLELGHRLRGELWAHGAIEGGNTPLGVDEVVYSGSRLVVRAGLEQRACAWDGAACLTAGLDLGYRHERLEAEYEMKAVDDIAVFERVGLDLGTRHFRVRPAYEMTSSASKGLFDGIAMSGNIAYVW